MLLENLKSNLTKNAQTSATSKVYLYPEAYFTIIYHSLMYANRLRDQTDWLEVLGFLSGFVKTDETSKLEIIHITKAWPISHGDAVSVSIDNYGSILQRIVVKLGEKETIIGWYHSHPSFGLFMSQTDFETQTSYQRLYNKAIAIVFDHTLLSSIHSGLEAYRLKKDFRTFEKIPIHITHNYNLQLNQSMYELFMDKIISKNYLHELDATYD